MCGGSKPPPPLLCWKWQWPRDPNPQTPTRCCNVDAPWLFKSLQSLASLAQSLLFHATAPSSSNPTPARRGSPAGSLTLDGQGETEYRALARGKEATVLEFYSRKCRLCNSLLDLVLRFESRNCDWASFVIADAENELWFPELLHYDIKYAPCFVLLDKHGRALAKTGVPSGRLHVIAGLSHLLKLKHPQKNDENNVL